MLLRGCQLLSSITHQVLVTPAPLVHVQQPLDSDGQVVIDAVGCWKSCNRGDRGLVETGFDSETWNVG